MPVRKAIGTYSVQYFSSDFHGVADTGDFIRTKDGSVLLVVDVKGVKRRSSQTEYRLRVQPLGRGAELPASVTPLSLTWFTHEEREALRSGD